MGYLASRMCPQGTGYRVMSKYLKAKNWTEGKNFIGKGREGIIWERSKTIQNNYTAQEWDFLHFLDATE